MRPTKTIAGLLLAIVALSNVQVAMGEENEFIQSRAWAFANAKDSFGNNIDEAYDVKVGTPRHYVTAYQLLITDLFGLQFQCASSCVWAAEYDGARNLDECMVYLRTGVMRFESGDDFFPYAAAAWRGTLVVKESSEYWLEHSREHFHQFEAGSEVRHTLTMTIRNLVTGDSARIQRDFTEDAPREGPPSYIPAGVYDIRFVVESYFPRRMYSYSFDNIQGDVFLWFHRND